MQQPKYYAFFDVDGTILKMTGMLSFLDYCHQHYYTISLKGTLLSCLYKFKRTTLYGHKNRKFLNRLYYQNYKNMNVEKVNQLGRRWFVDCVLKKNDVLNESVIQQLKNHKKNQAEIVLVSGSFEACLLPLAEHLNIKNILCIRPTMHNGKYTGNISGIQTIADGKVKAIEAFMKKHHIEKVDLGKSYAYGDHISDLSMLKMVKNPCVVKNSSPTLLAYAKQQNWTII